MTFAAVSGSFESAGAPRPAPVRAAQLPVGSLATLATGALGRVVVVLPVVGLLLGLVLITAGCGPPN